LQVAEHAEVALEWGEEMVPIPRVQVTKTLFSRAPIKTILISDFKMKELVQRIWSVALPAPYLAARRPTHPGARKVGAEDAQYAGPSYTTFVTPAYPCPKCLGSFLIAKDHKK